MQWVRVFGMILFCQLSHPQLIGQTSLEGDLISVFEQLESKYQIRIFYQEEYIPEYSITIILDEKDINEILDEILSATGLSYIDYLGHSYIIAPTNRINRDYDKNYFLARKDEAQETEEEGLSISVDTIGDTNLYDPSKPVIIEGFVVDDDIGDPVIGATILVEELADGVIANEIGQYRLESERDEFTLRIQAVGFIEKRIRINVLSSGVLDIELTKSPIRLDEVVITSQAASEDITRREVGLERLSSREIEKLPSFLGETDVIKSLLLLPGVSTVGEGSGGFNVRGGTVDQNLIMQDGMYFFNSSHVLGLFSLFHPDLVEEVNLYKGNIPIKYGGRLSSVLDVKIKEGSFQKFTGEGGIGFVSNRLVLETPIKKGESSLIIGARSTYSDWLFDIVNFANLRQSSAYFYDGLFKFTWRFRNRGKWNISGYSSKDRFKYADEFDFRWHTNGVSSTLNYLLTDQISVSLEGVFSHYTSQWIEPEGNRAFELKNGISYFKLRPELLFNPNESHALVIGLEGNSYQVDPGSIIPLSETSITVPKDIQEDNGRDLAVYAGNEMEVSERLILSLGVRYSIFQSLGPASVNVYEAKTPISEITIAGTEEYSKGEVIKSYRGWEPRLSLNFRFNDDNSVKLSYNRLQQFIHQISNTAAISPVDVWQLSNLYIEPQRSHNYSIGYFKNFPESNWETSFEIFYRDIDNLIEYKDLADLLVNDHLETELLNGKGRSYGAEFSLKKKLGRWNGWLGYTYSRTERRTVTEFPEEAINQNEWFLSNYDKPHDLSLALSYYTSKRTYFSMNFVYSSGRPTTAPVGSFSIENALNVPLYSERNQFRIPDYHRLDLSYTIEKSYKKNQTWRSSWTFSVYNLYGRRNAFTVFFTQAAFSNPVTNRLSVLGSPFPSISYNFSF